MGFTQGRPHLSMLPAQHDVNGQPPFLHASTIVWSHKQIQSHRASLSSTETPETMSHNELSPCCFSSVFVTKNRKPSYHRLAYSLSSLKCTTHQLCYWSQLCDLFPKRYGERHIQELWESLRRVLCILSCLRREICPQKILAPSAWIRGEIAQCWIKDM